MRTEMAMAMLAVSKRSITKVGMGMIMIAMIVITRKARRISL